MFYITTSFSMVTPFVNKLSTYVNARYLTIYSFLILLAVFILATSYTRSTSSWMLVMPFIFTGIAVALMYHCSTSIALDLVLLEDKGAATGIFFTNTLVGGALGVAISSISMRPYGEQSLSLSILENAFTHTMWIGVLVAALGLILSAYLNRVVKSSATKCSCLWTIS